MGIFGIEAALLTGSNVPSSFSLFKIVKSDILRVVKTVQAANKYIGLTKSIKVYPLSLNKINYTLGSLDSC